MVCPECERGMIEKVTINAQLVPVAIEWITCPTCHGTGIYHASLSRRSTLQDAPILADWRSAEGYRFLGTNCLQTG